MNNQQHILIVGGGIAGLTAAIEATNHGHRVSLYEKSAQVGGRGQTQLIEGFHFNLGAHALYRNLTAMNTMHRFGLTFSGNKPAINRHALAFVGDNAHAFPATPATIAGTSLFSLRDRLAYAAANARLMTMSAANFESTTWADWLDANVTNTAVRSVFESLGRIATYTNAPDRINASTVIGQLQTVLRHSVLYIDGGWQTWVDDLVALAESKGVSITCSARVNGIESQDDGSFNVVVGGDVVSADSIIIATTPDIARKLLPDSTSLAQQCASMHPIRVASLTVALRRMPNPDCAFAAGIDAPTYLSVHSAAAKLAPDDGGLIHTMRYLAPDHNRDAATDRAELEMLLDKTQPGWRDELVHAQFLPRITVAHTIPQADHARPTVHIDDTPNVYLAGAWVGDEGLLVDASVASALKAVALLNAPPRETTHA